MKFSKWRDKNKMPVTAAYADRRTISSKTVQMLVAINAVAINPDTPFILSSGWASPIYVDCRKLISFPILRQTITDFGASIISRELGFEAFDSVAGGESAGIPFAAWMAEKMMLPMHYVRKNPRGLGRQAQIEGRVSEGERVLLVEDLTTDGRSKIKFCNGLRQAGAIVDHVFVIFHHDTFPIKDYEPENQIRLHSLATCRDILDVSRKEHCFETKTIDALQSFLEEPLEWSKNHGGASEPI